VSAAPGQDWSDLGFDPAVFVVNPPDSLDGLLGFGFERPDRNQVMRGRFTVTEAHCQQFGILHGGVYAVFAESLASIATVLAVFEEGRIAVGQSNMTSLLASVGPGTEIQGEARPVHRGRTSWVWHVTMTDPDGRSCAVTTVTMAVRDRRW
jgi:uncharacterized protein (TIGR00369 family)